VRISHIPFVTISLHYLKRTRLQYGERTLLRTAHSGLELDNIILTPPLIIPREQVDGMVGIPDASLALAREFDLLVEGDRSGRYRCNRDSVSIRR
jgi:hypothetical protein